MLKHIICTVICLFFLFGIVELGIPAGGGGLGTFTTPDSGIGGGAFDIDDSCEWCHDVYESETSDCNADYDWCMEVEVENDMKTEKMCKNEKAECVKSAKSTYNTCFQLYCVSDELSLPSP